MEFNKIMVYVGYVISTFLFVVGVLILSGFLFPPNVPQKFRIMFGVVLVLYGIYRFLTSRIKKRQKDEERFIL
jgi:NADH:ubiquinone oxidoreductase subunit 6 (subunit J)